MSSFRSSAERILEICTYFHAEAERLASEPEAFIQTCMEFQLKPESLRRVLWAAGRDLRGPQLSEADVRAQVKGIDPELRRAIVKKLKGGRARIEELADHFTVAPKVVRAVLADLEQNHVIIDRIPGSDVVSIGKDIQPESQPLQIDFTKHGEIEYGFGFVADTHLASKYARLDVLEALYDRFEFYGFTDVFHGGNIIEGEARFNRFDLLAHGINGQTEFCARHYPQRKNMVTRFIAGDDHEGWWVQREGINIGAHIEEQAQKAGRSDLQYIGYMERDIEFKQPDGSAAVRVIHAGGGSAYAISYTSQKYAESLQGGEKPKVVLVGHFHKFDYSYPREIHIVQGGCTQDQTPFMRKKKLQAMVGGCAIWMKQAANGVITSFKVEWIPFYDKKFYAYHW